MSQLNVKVNLSGNIVYNENFDSFPLVLGRGVQCHISLPYDVLSRNHAVITVINDEIKLTDLESDSGINYQNQIQSEFTIHQKGEFWIGPLKFILELGQTTELSNMDDSNFNLHASGETAPPTQLSDINDLGAILQDDSGPSGPSLSFDNLEVNKVSETRPTTSSTSPSQLPPASKPPTLQDNPYAPRYQQPMTTPLTPPPSPPRWAEAQIGDAAPSSRSFTVDAEREAQALPMQKLALQGIISWGEDIFDVINFFNGEKLIFGPHFEDMAYLPIFKKSFVFGSMTSKGAVLSIPKQLSWKIYRNGHVLAQKELVSENRINERRDSKRFQLQINEVISIDLNHEIQIHFRYVNIPRPFIRRDWIENKEEFKKAILFSSLMHLVATLFSLYVAPKSAGPTIENVPPRFAKLLVEPPPQVLSAPPPKLPEPEPEPEPPPKAPEEKKVVVQKPPKPKPVVKIEKPPPAPKQVKQAPPPQKQTAPPEPQISEEEQQAQEMAALFNKLPTSKTAGGLKGLEKNIKIDSKNTKATGGGLPVAGMFKTLSKTGSGGESITAGPGGASLAMGNVKSGFAQGQVGSRAGQRKVGASVVGTPSFKSNQGPQGLSNDEIMKVIQTKLPDIHRCYERALFENSDIKGRVEYQWTISAEGAVADAQVTRSEVSNGDFLNRCVIGVIQKMKFPKSKKNLPTIANIGFPFGRG